MKSPGSGRELGADTDAILSNALGYSARATRRASRARHHLSPSHLEMPDPPEEPEGQLEESCWTY